MELLASDSRSHWRFSPFVGPQEIFQMHIFLFYYHFHWLQSQELFPLNANVFPTCSTMTRSDVLAIPVDLCLSSITINLYLSMLCTCKAVKWSWVWFLLDLDFDYNFAQMHLTCSAVCEIHVHSNFTAIIAYNFFVILSKCKCIFLTVILYYLTLQ